MDIIAVLDDKEVEATLARLAAKVGNMKPLMTRIGALYERRVLENFKHQSAPDGTPWKALSPVTLMLGLTKKKGVKKAGGLSARGKRYLSGKKILFDKGDLSGSIHFQADATSVMIGSSGSIPYAAIHQFGGKAGRGQKVTIPARPYLAMNSGTGLTLAEEDRSWILDLIREEMQA
ncbi:MAG: phage virion morphogenesis protein [Proteobacteria bacterium]|nr:phage virion morphogenesis protein [Pseudomonadota bacterium]